jgi:hypothetical protein
MASTRTPTPNTDAAAVTPADAVIVKPRVRAVCLALAVLVGSQVLVACEPSPAEQLYAVAVKAKDVVLAPVHAAWTWVYNIVAPDDTVPDPRTVPRVRRNVSCAVTIMGGIGVGPATSPKLVPSGVLRFRVRAHDSMARWFPHEWKRLCQPPTPTFGQQVAHRTFKTWGATSYPNDATQVPVIACRSFVPPDFLTGEFFCYTAHLKVASPGVFVKAFIQVY